MEYSDPEGSESGAMEEAETQGEVEADPKATQQTPPAESSHPDMKPAEPPDASVGLPSEMKATTSIEYSDPEGSESGAMEEAETQGEVEADPKATQQVPSAELSHPDVKPAEPPDASVGLPAVLPQGQAATPTAVSEMKASTSMEYSDSEGCESGAMEEAEAGEVEDHTKATQQCPPAEASNSDMKPAPPDTVLSAALAEGQAGAAVRSTSMEYSDPEGSESGAMEEAETQGEVEADTTVLKPAEEPKPTEAEESKPTEEESEPDPFRLGAEVEAVALKGLVELNGEVGKVVKMQGERVVVDFGSRWGEKALRRESLVKPVPYVVVAGTAAGVVAAVHTVQHDDFRRGIEAKIANDVAYVSSLLRKAVVEEVTARQVEQKPYGATQNLPHILENAHRVFECPFCETEMGVRYASRTTWLRCNSCTKDKQLDICAACAANKRDLEVSYHPNDHTFSNLSAMCKDNREAVVLALRQNLIERIMSYPIRRRGVGVVPEVLREVEQSLGRHRGLLDRLNDGRECRWCGVAVGWGYKDVGWYRCNTCNDVDMCESCYGEVRDGDVEVVEGHGVGHRFSDVHELAPGDPAPPVSPERKKMKPTVVDVNSLREGFPPVHYCPSCCAPFDVANPYNPRCHPNDNFGGCDLVVKIHSQYTIHPCGLCKKTIKLDPGAVCLSSNQDAMYCGDCLATYLTTSKTDPTTGKPIPGDAVAVHFAHVAVEIKQMSISCLYCAAEITLSNYESHVDECSKRRVCCRYRSFACPFTAEVGFEMEKHEEECLFGKMQLYIKRNEKEKSALRGEVDVLREELACCRRQLDLVVRESNFVYSSEVFVDIEEDGVGSTAKDDLVILHCKNRAAISQEKVIGKPRQTWSDVFKGSEITLTPDRTNCKGGRSIELVLGTLPMKYPGIFYWEYLIKGMPSCGSVRVGIARNPPHTSHTTGLDLNKPVGQTELSWGWYSSGTFVHDQDFRLDPQGEPTGNRKPLIHNEEKLRFTSGDYLGFLLDTTTGELFLYRNRVPVGKHTGMNKKIIDPHSKRKSDPVYFAAASPGFGHHGIELRPNPPMPKKPKEAK